MMCVLAVRRVAPSPRREDGVTLIDGRGAGRRGLMALCSTLEGTVASLTLGVEKKKAPTLTVGSQMRSKRPDVVCWGEASSCGRSSEPSRCFTVTSSADWRWSSGRNGFALFHPGMAFTGVCNEPYHVKQVCTVREVRALG